MRIRKPMDTAEEMKKLREKAKQCATLFENILVSPWRHSMTAYALMEYCFRQMVFGMTPYYPGEVEDAARFKALWKERARQLEDALCNFRGMPSAGNAAVLYAALFAEFGGNEIEVSHEQSALNYFAYRFGKMRGLGLDGFLD